MPTISFQIRKGEYVIPIAGVLSGEELNVFELRNLVKNDAVVRSFSVSSQDGSSTGIFFQPDGTKMYVIGDNSNRVYSYTLSTPWNIGTANYDNVSFSVSSQDILLLDIFFKPDGMKMYIVGDYNNRVYSYTLSTPWNISTAIYDNVFFSVSSQESSPTGIFFKPDGTKMYVAGYGGDKIYSYTLSTPWDIGTANYDNVSFSVSLQDGGPSGGPQGIFFRPDGTKMYMVGLGNRRVYSYTLSTPWNLNTASYDNVFLSVSQDNGPTDIFFKPDGTRMYMVGIGSDRVYSYTLSTPWNITTATYDNVSFSVSSQDGTPTGIFFQPDGTKMYMVGSGTDRVYSYTLI
jgi:DNA-binding beta-propeller fold protein YncE